MKTEIQFYMQGLASTSVVDTATAGRLVDALGKAWNSGEDSVLTLHDSNGGSTRYINLAHVQMVETREVQ